MKNKIEPTNFGFNLEIINNVTKEHLSKGLMSDSMHTIIKELQEIIDELKFLYPSPPSTGE